MALSKNLSKKTGFHFELTPRKKNGTGQIVIKYSNDEEFNKIYTFLNK